MILFDNIFYLLYDFFERTKFGTYGSRLTSVAFTSMYIYIGICLTYFLLNILYYLLGGSIDLNNNLLQNHYLFNFNANTFIYGNMVCFTLVTIRYYTLKTINKIYEKIYNRGINKKKRLNLLTVTYMVTSPFLLFFIASYVKDLYR